MCGIVGYIGTNKAVPIILEGLKRLEYRGYDSAGLAVYCDDGELAVRRAKGKLRNLEDAIRMNPVDGTFGIGHTRWATHGRPTEENAHPHRDCKGDVVVVHNGIVENYLALKQQLQSEGHVFKTETDTEVIAHLVEKHFNGNLEEAVRARRKGSHGRLRPGGDLALRPEQDRRRALRPAGRDRHRRQRVLRRLRRARHPQPHPGHVLSGRWRHGGAHPGGRASQRFRRPSGHAPGFPHPLEPHPGGKGRLQAFHAQGDFRAAARRPRYHARPRRTGDRPHLPRRDGYLRGRVRALPPGEDHRLRHQLARRPGRQVHDRAAGAHPGRSGLRQRVPLSRSASSRATR